MPAPGALEEVLLAEPKGAEDGGDGQKRQSQALLLAFFCLGAGSEALWGSLTLCIGTLAEAYGPSVMSTMSSVQNNFWLWTMVFFTLTPRPASNAVTLGLLVAASTVMLALSAVLAQTLRGGPSALPNERQFLAGLAVNGVCTGAVQILAASLSGMFSVVNNAVPGTLLLGVTAGPLLLALVSLVLGAVFQDPQLTSFVLLSMSVGLLVLSLLGLAWLSRAEAPPKPITMGKCHTDGGKNKEYLMRRLSEMASNSGLMLLTLLFGILVLCSAPYGAAHVCGGDAVCQAGLPALMVASCTISSFTGRFLATLRGGDKSIRRISVEVFLRGAFAGAMAWSYATGRFPVGQRGMALAVGGVIVTTIWGNGLTIDLSKESQKACGHSLIMPCPITAQITWISLQSGSLLGSLVSFVFK